MNSGNAMAKTVRNFLSVCVLFLCACSVALAQAGRGSISGLVTDPGGAVIQGAQVVLRNEEENLILEDRPSKGPAKLVLLSWRNTWLEEVSGVQYAVA